MIDFFAGVCCGLIIALWYLRDVVFERGVEYGRRLEAISKILRRIAPTDEERSE